MSKTNKHNIVHHNKTAKLLTFLIIFCMGYFVPICTSPSCQTNKRALGTYDPKVYHNAGCTCPCAKRYDIMPDGRCIECFHLQIHAPIIPLKTPNPSKLVNIEKLRQGIAARARVLRQ